MGSVEPLTLTQVREELANPSGLVGFPYLRLKDCLPMLRLRWQSHRRIMAFLHKHKTARRARNWWRHEEAPLYFAKRPKVISALRILALRSTPNPRLP
jgi:hypothetical protein